MNNVLNLEILSKPIKQALFLVIRAYQYLLSPIFGSNCRHYPTCSHYSRESLERHGVMKGVVLTLARLLRCNPWSLGGYDPVPDNVSFKNLESFKLTGNYQSELYTSSEALRNIKD